MSFLKIYFDIALEIISSFLRFSRYPFFSKSLLKLSKSFLISLISYSYFYFQLPFFILLLKLFLVFSKFKNKLLTSIIYFLHPYVMYRILNSTFYNIIIYKTHKQVFLSSHLSHFVQSPFFSFNIISVANYSIYFICSFFNFIFSCFFKKIIIYYFLSFFFSFL